MAPFLLASDRRNKLSERNGVCLTKVSPMKSLVGRFSHCKYALATKWDQKAYSQALSTRYMPGAAEFSKIYLCPAGRLCPSWIYLFLSMY